MTVVDNREDFHRKSINNLPFMILSLFVGPLTTRLPSGRFRIISQRPIAQGRSCTPYYQLVGSVQLCSGMFPDGNQPPDMMM